jgi:hypothetical protein
LIFSSDAAPSAPLPFPATPLWLPGNPDIDFQIVDQLAGQGGFGFQMFEDA